MTARGSLGPALVLLALIAALAVVVVSVGGPLPGEAAVSEVMRSTDGSHWRWLSQLGSGAVLYPALLLAAAVRWSRRGQGRAALLPVAVLVVAQTVEAVAFVTVERSAPTGSGYVGFSSGHAMTAVLGWGLVARACGRRAWPGVAAVGLVVASARVAVGAHWPSDVLAGALLGAAVLVLVDRVPSGERSAGRPPLLPKGAPWAWVVLVAAAVLSLGPLLLVDDQERMKDLLVYVGAGATAGAGSDVYDFRTPFDMPFTYPPFAAVLSEPLSRVPLGLMHVLWVLASLAALVGIARTALAPVVARLGLPLTVALGLLSSPVRSHLRFGQVGLFLVLLVAADLLHDRRRQGVGLGLAVAVKLTPAVLLPWLLLQRARAALTAVAVAAGATAFGLLVLWPSAQEYLWRALWDSSRFGPNDIPGNQSVRGMLLRSGLDERTATLCWLAAAVVLAVVGTLGARRLDREGNRLGALGVLAALSIAVSPVSWVHHLVFLALPLGALVAAGRHRLAAVWAVVLTISFPRLGSAGLRNGGPDLFWQLVVDLQGLTAVAAVLVLPRLLSHAAQGSARADTLDTRATSERTDGEPSERERLQPSS